LKALQIKIWRFFRLFSQVEDSASDSLAEAMLSPS